MPMIYVGGKQIRVGPKSLIGVGGEAEIFKVNATTVLKRYKQPTHPDLRGDTAGQAGARERIAEQQHKLPAFPRKLPPQVVAPIDLAYDKPNGLITGYTMPFVAKMAELMNYAVRTYREGGGIDNNQVLDVFRALRRVVADLHARGIVIGDFNDLNVMTDGKDVRLVDADSMQFGKFQCHTFTARFVDPLLCQPDRLLLARPHNPESDWYAYFVMLLQSLLYVGPYGGVHRPKTGKRLSFDGRVLGRVTFLDPQVVYPKPAVHYTVLPDEWLGYLEKVFVHDHRGEFPSQMLDTLRFTSCAACGTFHARAICPQCSAPGAPQKVMTIRGQVSARKVFSTSGRILQAVTHNGTLRYLYQQYGELYREGGRRLMSAELSPELRFRIQGETTYIGAGTTLLAVMADGSVERINVGTYRDRLPVFDTTSSHVYWEYAGQLLESGRLEPKRLGDVLPGQTLLWAGETRGFGFYQAGEITRAFLFFPGHTGLNDQVALPPITGQLTDAVCYFGADKVWFMTAVQVNGKLVNTCHVFDRDGALVATEKAEQGSDSWLGHGIRGHMTAHHSLFVSTDDGILRLGVSGGAVVREREFPDTEPFVDASTYLVAGQGGIYAVSSQEITFIQMK